MPFVVPFIYGFVSGFAATFGSAAGIAGATAAGATAAGAAGVVAGYYAAVVVVSGVVSAVAQKALAPDAPNLGQQLQTNLEPSPAKKFVYGETRIGGSFVYVNTTKRYNGDPGNYSSYDETKERQLHMVIELAGHPIEQITGVYIDDNLLSLAPVNSNATAPGDDLWPGNSSTDTNGKTRWVVNAGSYKNLLMFKFYPTGSSTADQDLIDSMQFAGSSGERWTTDQKGIDKAYVYVRAYYNPEIFQGFPTFTFQVKGKKDILDTRTSTTGYTENPALILADYMVTDRYLGGLGETWDQIDTSSVNDAANVCDESLAYLYNGATENRYYLGGEISTAQSPANIMSQILSTMAGWTERINGKWQINAGAYTPPSVTITESELAGRPSVKLNQSSKDSYNSVRTTIRAPQNQWLAAPVPSMEYQVRKDIDGVFYGPSPDGAVFLVTHSLEDGDRVRFTNWTGAGFDNTLLPNGLTDNVYYYVVSSSLGTTPYQFKVALTKNGSPLVLSHNGHSTLTYWHDPFLTIDGERKTQDTQYSLVNSIDLARRLSLIDLRTVRQEVTAQITCKLGTPYASIFDIKVGDAIRWIDAHKDFWEYKSGSIAFTSPINLSGWFTSSAHGLSDGDPVVVTDADNSGITQTSPFYVINPDTDHFQISNYRGGSAVTSEDFTDIELQEIQGKLFKVDSWALDLSSQTPLITLQLIETVTTLYDWTNQNEVEVEDTPGITTDNPFIVDAPTTMSIKSGTDTLYIKQDGTVGSRAEISWAEANDNFVKQGGFVEVQYKRSPRLSGYNNVNNLIYHGGHPTASYTGSYEHFPEFGTLDHQLDDWDIIRFVPSASDSLPTPLSESFDYYAYPDGLTHTYTVVSYRGSTSDIDIVGTGSFNWEDSLLPGGGQDGAFYVDIEKDWVPHAALPGNSTNTYIVDLKDGENYDFRIRFKNAIGAVSEWNYLYNEYVAGKVQLPNPPVSASATFESSSYDITVSWLDPADLDLSHIDIWRRIGDVGGHTKIASVNRGVTRYVDDAFPSGSDQTWDYQLTAVDTSNGYSTIVSASVNVPPIPLLNNFNAASSSTDSITFNISWDNDGSPDEWAVVQYVDIPSYNKFTTDWNRLSDVSSSYVVAPGVTDVAARGWRVKIIDGSQYISEPTNWVSASIEPIPQISNFSLSTGSFFGFTASWDNDGGVNDWAVLQYSDANDFRNIVTDWVVLSDVSSSYTMNTNVTDVAARAFRVSIINGSQYISEPSDWISSSLKQYGSVAAPLTGSVSTTNQIFEIYWNSGSDNHPLDYYEVYINFANSTGSATLLDTTTSTKYTYLSPYPDVVRYFWIRKVSVTGEKSDYSLPYMRGTCGWDADKTRVLDFSNILIYDPPLPSSGVGREIDRTKRWTLNFNESESLAYGPITWEVTVTNNDTEAVDVYFQTQVVDNSGSNYDLTTWGTTGNEIAAGESRSIKWTGFKVGGEINGAYDGYKAYVNTYGWRDAGATQLNNVTISLDEAYIYGQIYPTPEGTY